MNPDYPRDLIGYANNPPHPHWPGDARIALSFVLNYEEGGERNVLHGDKESEAFLSEMVSAQPLLGERNLCMESLYEYGSRAGVWRLLKLFDAGLELARCEVLVSIVDRFKLAAIDGHNGLAEQP